MKRNLTPKNVTTVLLDEREEARKKATDSLSRYKFLMFGYWAGVWVHLNRILTAAGMGQPSPFTAIVKTARANPTAVRQINAGTRAAWRNPSEAWHAQQFEKFQKDLDPLLERDTKGPFLLGSNTPHYLVNEPMRGFYLAGRVSANNDFMISNASYLANRRVSVPVTGHTTKEHIEQFKRSRQWYQRSVTDDPKKGIIGAFQGIGIQAHDGLGILRLPNEEPAHGQAMRMYYRGMVDGDIASLKEDGLTDREIQELNPRRRNPEVPEYIKARALKYQEMFPQLPAGFFERYYYTYGALPPVRSDNMGMLFRHFMDVRGKLQELRNPEAPDFSFLRQYYVGEDGKPVFYAGLRVEVWAKNMESLIDYLTWFLQRPGITVKTETDKHVWLEEKTEGPGPRKTIPIRRHEISIDVERTWSDLSDEEILEIATDLAQRHLAHIPTTVWGWEDSEHPGENYKAYHVDLNTIPVTSRSMRRLNDYMEDNFPDAKSFPQQRYFRDAKAKRYLEPDFMIRKFLDGPPPVAARQR